MPAAKALPMTTQRRVRPPSAGDLLLGRQWAMMPDRVQALRALAAQALANPQALTAWADARVPDTFCATERDGIATVQINGPLCRVWDFWAWIFGCTPYEVLATDLTRLRDNAAVRAIVLSIDSPGGEALGCGELAALIHHIRDVKPIVAHAAGLTCSAAYWIASATERVIADPSAIVGSVGACATFVDFSGMYEELGIEVIEMVSTQSPRKNADPTTREGRADWQALLDSLASVFIADVARFRGVDEETVLADYGQGGVFVGQEAVDAGLADALGTAASLHTALLAQLTDSTNPPEMLMARTTKQAKITGRRTTRSTLKARRALAAAEVARLQAEEAEEEARLASSAEETPADDDEEEEEKPAAAEDEEDGEEEEEDEGEQPEATVAVDVRLAGSLTPAWLAEHAPAVAAAVRTEGATTERDRILAIHQLGAKVKGEKAQSLIVAGMQDPNATKETVALQLLELGASGTGADYLAARAGDEASLKAPSNAENPVAASGEELAVVQRITSTYHAHRQSRNAAAGRN